MTIEISGTKVSSDRAMQSPVRNRLRNNLKKDVSPFGLEKKWRGLGFIKSN